jgi:metal-responsive CopG/Arc/MetJ family transcriptional regulator
MGRISVSIDDDLEEELRRQADQEDINISDLVGRGVEYYLNEHSLEARMAELEQRVGATEEGVSGLEQRVDEVEEQQNRGITDKVSEAFGRDRSPPG